jgi:hypothetical protein
MFSRKQDRPFTIYDSSNLPARLVIDLTPPKIIEISKFQNSNVKTTPLTLNLTYGCVVYGFFYQSDQTLEKLPGKERVYWVIGDQLAKVSNIH